jgi:hypothetical protein
VETIRKALEAGVYMIKCWELAKLVGVEHLEMEEVNGAARNSVVKAVPKS